MDYPLLVQPRNFLSINIVSIIIIPKKWEVVIADNLQFAILNKLITGVLYVRQNKFQ